MIVKDKKGLVRCIGFHGALFTILVNIMLSVRLVISQEPSCSKYDFEEKILEKMVRMEFQMERLTTEAKAYETRIINMEKQLNLVAGSTHRPTVAFKARLGSYLLIKHATTIVFPVILLNKGSVYDKNTGIFTVPVNGTYFFSVQLCPFNNQRLIYRLIVDGETHNLLHLLGDSGHSCSNSDTIVILNMNQRVWIQIVPYGGDCNLDNDENERWNSFAGMLVGTQ